MNIALEISYVGKNYSGWQVQPDKTTVQGVLELALEKIFSKKVTTTASGRTDAGVSAYKQVVNFNIDTTIPVDRLVYIINDNLPRDVRVLRSYQVADDFNARFSAKRKTYEYHFYFGVENALISSHALHIKGGLDISKMQEAAKYFVGEYDFSAFCAADTEVVSKVREVYSCEILECGNYYKLRICGNGFLYNMVRIIMGTLISVGYGKIKPSDIPEIIKSLDRSKAGITVPPDGLVLLDVEY